jgi:DNA invertase Pin-like site-specific DNA recombinase
MRAIAYVRFSSDQQADGSSIERQTASVEAYARRADLTLVRPYLIDDGYSAFKGHHISEGKLGRFLAEVDAGRWRGAALVVEEMDRLSRLGIDQTHDILRRLLKGDVLLHIANENRVVRDLDDMMTAIFNVIKSSTAQDYSRKHSERVRGGWARAKANAAKGELVTRNLPAWLKIEKGKIVENEKAALLREAFRLAALGVGAKNILKKLNDSLVGSKGYSLSWLSRSLCNRAVLGEFQPHRYENGRRIPCGDVVPGYFPAIVTPSEWEAARREIARKNRIPSDQRHRGGDRHSDIAHNLFSGLLRDVTSQPERGMGFAEPVKGQRYLASVFCPRGRKANRIKYDRFEKAFLGFLADLDWKSVAGASESAEEKAAKEELEAVLGELDRTLQRIATKMKAMDDEGLNVGTLRVLAGGIARDQDRLAPLEAERNALQLTVESARAKSTALYTPESLVALIRAGTPEANEARLRLRREIRNRIDRIDFTFCNRYRIPGITGIGVRIEFVNGEVRRIVLKEDGGYTLVWPSPEGDEDGDLRKSFP